MHWRRKWQPTPVFLPEGAVEPGGLLSMGSHRVGHECSDLAAAAAAAEHLSGSPGVSVVKNPPTDAGERDLIPGSERSPRKGHGNPL